MEQWYAVQTKARQEVVARENLERQSYKTYLPRIRVSKRIRSRARGSVEPLFPGYVFVHVDPLQEDIAPIRSTRGAIGLVRFAGKPCPVPDEVIDGLSQAQREKDDPIDPLSVLDPGDRVTIVGGALAGLTAILESRSGKERVCLLLNLLGRSNRVMVDASELSPSC